ncbi:MAG: CvpA family protein [Clostridia bacterium]
MTNFYSVLLDIILVLIGLLCVYTGYKRGFIAALLSICSWIISFVLAIFLSGVISQFTYDNFIAPGVEKSISDTIKSSVDTQSLKNGIDTQLDKMPVIIKDVIYDTFPNLENNLAKYLENDASEIPKTISHDIIKPVVTVAISMICFMILFILLSIIFGFIARRFRGRIRIPIVGQANAILGGAIGIIKGLIMIFIVVIICDIIISATNNQLPVLNKEITEKSYVYETISNLSPFNHIGEVK